MKITNFDYLQTCKSITATGEFYVIWNRHDHMKKHKRINVCQKPLHFANDVYTAKVQTLLKATDVVINKLKKITQ